MTGLLVAHVDYLGRLRGRRVPVDDWDRVQRSGVTFHRSNLNLTIADDLPDRPVLGATSGDIVSAPLPDTRRQLALERPLDLVFTRFREHDGSAWAGCPRTLLEHEVEQLASVGVRATVGFELEGYLFEDVDADADAGPGPKGFSDVSALVEVEPFAELVAARAAAAGVPLLQFSKEMGPHQFELNFPPRSPVEAAEDLAVVALLARATARELGLRATFMPRPWDDAPTSGLHVHVSFAAPAGNAMGTAGDPPALGAAIVMGVLRHAAAVSFVAMPTVNSYKRLVPGIWTPVLACHSQENKDALVRFAGRDADRRIEFRGADGAASPYLLLAALLRAVRSGVEDPTPLDPALRVDDAVTVEHVEAWRAGGLPVLPSTLAEAIDAFERDPVVAGAFEPIVGPVLRQLKRREWTALARHVSRAERELYLRHY